MSKDAAQNPDSGKKRFFVPQKLGSLSSLSSSHLPKLGEISGEKNSKKKPKHLAPENVDSRTQIFGFSGSSTCGAGVGNELPEQSEVKGQGGEETSGKVCEKS